MACMHAHARSIHATIYSIVVVANVCALCTSVSGSYILKIRRAATMTCNAVSFMISIIIQACMHVTMHTFLKGGSS